MKQKGFTLVELLAVIVILAIIALIATPMILNVIDNAKKGAAEASANGYTDAIEKSILEEELKGNIKDKNKVYTIKELDFVNIKGDKPSEGWVQLEKGVTVDYSLKIGEYVINYENGQAKAEKGDTLKTTPDGSVSETPEVVICTAATTKSIDSAKLASDGEPYAYGVEYNCDPGDGTTRTFFVLEESGDNISLIMNGNIDSTTVAWSNDGVTALMYLQSQTAEWANVDLSLPTAQQIATAGGDTSWDDNTYTGNKLSTWLYANLNGTKGYWTSTYRPNLDRYWNVNDLGELGANDIINAGSFGVRPVITISKTQVS